MSDAEKAALKALREIVAMLDSVGDFTLSSAARFGDTDDVVLVEYAKGFPTSCLTRASLAKMLPQWKRDHPDAHFHETPKVTESPSLARREVIADKRQRWLDLYGSRADTLRRLLAEHDIDAGWRSSYSTTWRREVPCSVDDLTPDKVAARMMGDYMAKIAPPGTVPMRSVDCSGARDRFHVNTAQAGRVATASYRPIDGLEAALWCDYACSTCQADARRMARALEARLDLEQAEKARSKQNQAVDKQMQGDTPKLHWPNCKDAQKRAKSLYVIDRAEQSGIHLFTCEQITAAVLQTFKDATGFTDSRPLRHTKKGKDADCRKTRALGYQLMPGDANARPLAGRAYLATIDFSQQLKKPTA